MAVLLPPLSHSLPSRPHYLPSQVLIPFLLKSGHQGFPSSVPPVGSSLWSPDVRHESVPLHTVKLAALKDTRWGQRQPSQNHTSRVLHSGQEVLGKEKCPERTVKRHVALPLNKNRMEIEYAGSAPDSKRPLAPTLESGQRRPPTRTVTSVHTCGFTPPRAQEDTPVAERKSWKVDKQGGARLASFLLGRNKRTKPSQGSGRNSPTLKEERGAPFEDSPAPSRRGRFKRRERGVTSRGQRGWRLP